jgi:hypothetical protein
MQSTFPPLQVALAAWAGVNDQHWSVATELVVAYGNPTGNTSNGNAEPKERLPAPRLQCSHTLAMLLRRPWRRPRTVRR